MRRLKKATAIILVVAMMFSTVVGGNTVQAETSEMEYQDLVLDQEVMVTIDENNRGVYFSFTPETSDYYIFESFNAPYELDPYVDIYEMTDTGLDPVERDDDGGEDRNFKLGYLLTAGETYYYYIHHRGEMAIGTYQVLLTVTPVASAVFEPVEVVKNVGGYYESDDTDEEFYYYNNWQSNMRYTITMKDGGTAQGSGWGFSYNDEYYPFEFQDQQYENHWTVGNTYTVTVDAAGYQGQVQVSVVECPVQSVQIEPITIIENTMGWLHNEGTEDEYFYYSWTHKINATITMKNGDVVTVENSWDFYYNDQWYSFSQGDAQWDEPWKVGNTYTVTTTVMGYETQAQVSIVESPVQSIAVQPIAIMEHSNGYWSEPGTDHEYFHYWWSNKMNFVITLKNGQVITGENTDGFNYNNEWHNFSWDNIQNSSSPWLKGNTYTQTVSALGYETTVNITITDTPVQSVVVEPISIMEGTTGSLWYAGTKDEFYHYDWTNAIRNYTITMKDGTIYTSTNGNSGIHYDGEWHHFTLEDDQEANHWMAGNTYTAKANIMGYSVDVEVIITESPVESIVVEPITMAEHTNGAWNSGGPIGPGGPSGPTGTDSWYNYFWYNHLQYTLTLKDGRVIQGRGMGVTVDNQYYGFSWNDTQHEEHWYAGNTYTTSISCMGKRADVTVSICEMNQTDGYEYMVQDGCAIIIGCGKEDKVLNIPSVVDGYPVIGITDLTYAMEYAEELVIPDSVTMLSGSIFEWNYDLKKLTIGKGISNIYNEMFIGATCLEEIIVSEENPYYISVDGVVYDKEMTTLVVFPRAKEGAYTVPDTVTNIDCLIDNIAYYNVQLDLGNSQTGYVVEDGVIYNADKTVIYACDRTKTGKYVMPDTVTTINEGAFQKCSFSEVVVSENVSEIVYAAFSYSMELEKVVLPENLKAIEWGAFSECENLAEADLPSGLEILETSSFYKTGITSVTVPGTVIEVGYGAYKESQVAELTLEEGIEVVWGEAFRDTQLKSVVIPDSLTHMGGYVFADTPLESVTIGAGLEAISYNAFENTKLTTVTIPENIAEIGEYAFANSTLEEAIIEKNDVYIYEGAFYNCPLKEIDLKDGVVAIADYAFYGNQAESIVIPDSVTDVTYKSFAESKKLLNIDVPDDLDSIDGTAFDGTAWWDAQADGVVYLENYLYGYKGEMPEGTEIVVKDGTKLIANYAFDGEHNLMSLSIPSSVTGIGWGIFEGCLNLEKVTVAEGNTIYFTNEDGTILYDQYKDALWKRVENIWDMDIVQYIDCGTSIEDWLSDGGYEGMQHLWVEYADGSYGWEPGAVTPDMVSGFDSTKPGWQIVTIDFGRLECEMEVYVEIPGVNEIVVSKLPDKIEYDLYQDFETAGMVVKAITESGEEFEIIDYEVYGFDSSEAGTKTVTVAYRGFETTFEVEVIDRGGTDVPTPPTEPEEPEEPVTIEKVSINSSPRKTTYELGETIDLDGLSVAISYSDGSSEILYDGFVVSGYDSSVAGEQTVTVTHEETGVTVSFVVTVNEPIIDVPEVQKAEVMIGNAAGKPGDEVQVSISFKEEATIKSIAISDFEYDKEKLELVSAEWDVKGVLSDWGTIMENAGVLTFANNTAVKGNVLTFTFRILDGVENGSCEIACQVIAKEMLESGEEQNLDVTVTFGEIIIKNVIKGDVNGDGYVTSDDAIYLLYHTTNDVEYPINQDGDFDGNGYVTSNDAIYLLYHVMLPAQYPINK